jgi:hypothetical protein
VQVRAASRYFDVANFTPRITCPVLVGLGLIDEVCSPTSVLAAVNQITSPKEILILPKAQHGNVDGAQDAYMHRCYDVWLPALRNGLPAPVNISNSVAQQVNSPRSATTTVMKGLTNPSVLRSNVQFTAAAMTNAIPHDK